MAKNLDISYGKTHKKNRRKTTEALWGIACVSPLTVGLLLFLAVPLVYSFYISLCTYNGSGSPELTPGIIDNFKKLFDFSSKAGPANEFWSSIINAVIMSIGVLFSMSLALITANLICSKIKFSNFFKSIFFIPTICSSVAVTYMWMRMYGGTFAGTINLILQKLHLIGDKAIPWISDEYAVISIIFMTVLFGFGSSMLLYYSAIKGIPRSYYEAADMDGANAFQKFFYITIPSVSSVTFYILTTALIGSLQSFNVQWIFTGEGSNKLKGTMMPVMKIYMEKGADNYGMASAMGIMLGIIIAIVTAINFVVSKKWVHYES